MIIYEFPNCHDGAAKRLDTTRRRQMPVFYGDEKIERSAYFFPVKSCSRRLFENDLGFQVMTDRLVDFAHRRFQLNSHTKCDMQ